MSNIGWEQNLVDDAAALRELLVATKSIAVLGIKTEAQSYQPAFYVPKYLQSAGFRIIPVPVYYPEVTQILDQQVYRSLQEIPFQVDLVNIFRRPQHLELTSTISWRAARRECGCNRAFVTTELRKSSRRRGSGLSRIDA